MLLTASLTLGLAATIFSTSTLAALSPLDINLLPRPTSETVGLPDENAAVNSTVNTDYPLPNQGNVQIHDSNIVAYNGELYIFTSAVGIDYYKATNISGPWTHVGTVLNGPSIIDKPDINRVHPWAPTVIEQNDTFYCFYCVTKSGTRNSAVGIATSATLEPGSWTDHGAIFNTYNGTYADVYPFTISNAIDPAPIIDPVTGKPWIVYGSYWTNIWQIPLTDDLMAIESPSAPSANHLAYMYLENHSNEILSWYPLNSDPDGIRPEEGPYISYHAPYYYLWYAHGKCCGFHPNALPPAGTEYSIRVGRSATITGPYVDINGTELVQGGGQVVYGSNHDHEVYAPGGVGILSLEDGTDLLYFHYLNKSIGFGVHQTHLGWIRLDYQNGWPVVSDESTNGNSSSVPSAAMRFTRVPVLQNLGIAITTAWLIFSAL